MLISKYTHKIYCFIALHLHKFSSSSLTIQLQNVCTKVQGYILDIKANKTTTTNYLRFIKVIQLALFLTVHATVKNIKVVIKSTNNKQFLFVFNCV